jgi:hypothetical protein
MAKDFDEAMSEKQSVVEENKVNEGSPEKLLHVCHLLKGVIIRRILFSNSI